MEPSATAGRRTDFMTLHRDKVRGNGPAQHPISVPACQNGSARLVATLASMAVSQSRRARAARRRKRRVNLADNDLTPTQWASIQLAWGGCCAYCGATEVALQRDCVLPISRGGRYTLDNVVPACGSCNASKSNGEVTSWLRRRRLDEAAFLLAYRSTVVALTGPGVAETSDPGPS